MDMKNFCTALMPKPQGESCATDCGGDGARKHRTRRGTSRLLDTRHGARIIKVCKRDAELQHDVVWLHVGFASAHGAQAHADHDTRAVEAATLMESSRVAIVLCGRNEVWPTRSLVKRGLNLPSPSPSPPPRPRPSHPSPPAALPLRVRAPNSPGDARQLPLHSQVHYHPRPLASRCAFPSPERLSLCLFSLSYISLKNPSRVPWRTRHSLVAQTRTSVQVRTSGPKNGRTKEGGEVWPNEVWPPKSGAVV